MRAHRHILQALLGLLDVLESDDGSVLRKRKSSLAGLGRLVCNVGPSPLGSWLLVAGSWLSFADCHPERSKPTRLRVGFRSRRTPTAFATHLMLQGVLSSELPAT